MSKEFDELILIVRRLRKECPWDREQTHESLRQSFIEETYEAIESIDHKNWIELKNELGDVLLHVALQSSIAEEQGEFTLEEVIRGINEKLIRRHPHVFGEASVPDTMSQTYRWEKIKMMEGRSSVVDGVPKEMPALLRAIRLQEKASKVGFDWSEPQEVLKKVVEEIHEFQKAEAVEMQEEEYGDILFSLVNYSRFLHINPEHALRKSCEKFLRRFQFIEEELKRNGKDIYATSLNEMDELWNKAKAAS